VWEGWYRMKPRRSVLSEVDAPGYSVSDALSMRAYFTSSLCFIAEVAMLLPPYLMWGGSCAVLQRCEKLESSNPSLCTMPRASWVRVAMRVLVWIAAFVAIAVVEAHEEAQLGRLDPSERPYPLHDAHGPVSVRPAPAVTPVRPAAFVLRVLLCL
jgi:hypothetical protein